MLIAPPPDVDFLGLEHASVAVAVPLKDPVSQRSHSLSHIGARNAGVHDEDSTGSVFATAFWLRCAVDLR
jgi:hypothetical protein